MTGTVRSVGPASIIATLPRRHAAALGDELGLAGMAEADAVELLLRHRAGHDRRRRPRAGQADRQLERSRASNARRRRSGDRAGRRRADAIWISGRPYIESRIGLRAGRRSVAIGPSQTAASDARIADRDEWRQVRTRRGRPSICATTSGPIPAGSPSETASGLKGSGCIAPPIRVPGLAEFDHRVAAQVAQVAAGAQVDALFVDLVA